MAPRLSRDTLPQIVGDTDNSAASSADSKIGIVHLGWGGFARAHIGTILNDLPAAAKQEWGVSAISMRSPTIRDQLAPQDGLYTVTERRAEGDKTQIVDVVKETMVAPEERERVVARLANPDTKMVSMTITQKGYITQEPGADATMHSMVTEAIKRRKEAGIAPLAVVCLDNIQSNGDFTKKTLVDYAAQTDPELASHIEQNVAFPNTMVDRITPKPKSDDLDVLADRIGVRDEAAVAAEPYRQLVIEKTPDNVAMPPLGDVAGVKIVDDVKPFEAAKIKMLNGAHMMMGATGRVAGFMTVDECMADEDMGAFAKRFMSEVAATIDPIPGTNMQVYADDLADRFSNPRMSDDVDRLANDTSKKVHPRLFDALTDSLKKGTPNDALAVAAAGWVRFVSGEAPGQATPKSDGDIVGVTDKGRAYVVNDPIAEKLQAAARANPGNPDKLFEAVGLNLGDYGAEGKAMRRKIVTALETMNKDSSLSAIRSVTMRLDQLPVPVVPEADRGVDAPKAGPDNRPQPRPGS